MTDQEKDKYIFTMPTESEDEKANRWFYLETGFVIGVLFCIVLFLSYVWATHVA